MSNDASAGRGSGGGESTTRRPVSDSPGGRGVAIENAKFDLGAPPPPFDAGELPWGYGENRITALVRSPDSLYVTWEITDDGIADARKRLGAAGEWGWCNLRVYDTTARDFDGTNANDYFDVRVERGDREYYFMLRRPTASFHVEIGIKSAEGFFQAIARSGRADMPRKSPSPNQSLEWMTITSDVIHPSARPYQSKYKGGPPGPPPWASRPGTGKAGEGRWESPQSIAGGDAIEHRSWTWTHPATVEVRWEGPWVFDQWHAEWRLRWFGAALQAAHAFGPFTVELVHPDRFEVRYLGEGPIVLEESRSGLEVLGPWQVTIRSFESAPQRRVLSTWRVHWVRVSPPKVQRWWTAFERRTTGAYRREMLVGGASEAHLLVEGGASESWRLGASERMWLGASEWMAVGGSEVAWLGASQLSFAGASAQLFAGASALLYAGASEWRLGGASERVLGGASEWVGFGASEGFAPGGASEHAFLRGEG